MRRISIKDAPKDFLEGMAKSLARTIDAGTTHNAEGYPLAVLLDEVIAQIPHATEYGISYRER